MYQQTAAQFSKNGFTDLSCDIMGYKQSQSGTKHENIETITVIVLGMCGIINTVHLTVKLQASQLKVLIFQNIANSAQ